MTDHDTAAAVKRLRETVEPITDRPKTMAELCGSVSADEANAALKRFIASHFDGKGEHARISIPARPEYDDDLRLSAFIEQAGELMAKLEALRALPELPNVIATLRYDLDEWEGFSDACDDYPGECKARAAALRAVVELLEGGG